MTSWPTFRLGEALELAYGKGLAKRHRNETGTIPVYGSNGIAGWHTEALVEGPVVIIGRKGSAGAVQFVNGPCYPIDTTYFVQPRSGFDFEPIFLFYLLKKLDLPRLKTATGVPGLTREDAYRERIPVPPLPEQRRIVDILSRAEGIVRLRREAEKKAAELIPALFIEMFGDPAANPKGYPVKPLGALVDFISGGTPSKAREDYWVGDVPWVSPKDMKRPAIKDAIDSVNEKIFTETTIKRIPVGAVLIVVRGMILVHSVPIAISMVPLAINQDMRALIPGAKINGVFLLELLRILKSHLLGMVSTAAHGTKRIETEALRQLRILLPPIEEQMLFSEQVNRVNALQTQQAAATAKAQASFDALLAQAFPA